MAILTKTQLAKLRKKLKTDSAIAEQYGVSRQAIFQLRKKYGIESSHAEIPARNKKVIELYKKGMTGAKIAGKIGLSLSQTHRIINLGSKKKRSKRR
ncbi:MAG: hypothetical protein GF401_14200 [Chitinivibrionales bacterium]|nr:hypothetical protein [Chitinivibrionales bacterium]